CEVPYCCSHAVRSDDFGGGVARRDDVAVATIPLRGTMRVAEEGVMRAKVPFVIAAAIVSAMSFVACSDSKSGAECVSDRQYFQREVWGGFMGQTCTRCHTAGGPAVDQGARFVLQPSSYPNFIDANMAVLKETSKYTYEGKSLLLQKPLGRLNHGGG